MNTQSDHRSIHVQYSDDQCVNGRHYPNGALRCFEWRLPRSVLADVCAWWRTRGRRMLDQGSVPTETSVGQAVVRVALGAYVFIRQRGANGGLRSAGWDLPCHVLDDFSAWFDRGETDSAPRRTRPAARSGQETSPCDSR